MMLSELAEGVLSFLETTPAACENCVAAYRRIDRYDALKATRELILAGRVLCTSDVCPVCKEIYEGLRDPQDGGDGDQGGGQS